MSDRNWVLPKSKRCLSVGVTAADWRDLTVSLSPLGPDTEWLHLDVMDGQFVPKLTLGPWAVSALPEGFIIDAHVMTQSPIQHAEELVKQGAHVVTLQYEGLSNAAEALIALEPAKVSYQGEQFPLIRGVSLCPDTCLGVLSDLLPHVEMIQLLTLDPRSGVKLENDAFIQRLHELNALLEETGFDPLVSIDGSMSLELAKASVAEGVQVIVSGSALFSSHSLSDNLLLWRNHLYS
jgi:ribulose-phosphate 3-epimerase